MKKLIIIGLIFLASGCTPIGKNNVDSATSSVASSTELNSSAGSTYSGIELNQSNSELRKDSSSADGVEAGEDVKSRDSTILKSTVNEIRLVPQKADRENGFTLENDTVLQGGR